MKVEFCSESSAFDRQISLFMTAFHSQFGRKDVPALRSGELAQKPHIVFVEAAHVVQTIA